jgi:glycosyltransferase involved in cell wall biosynthesis
LGNDVIFAGVVPNVYDYMQSIDFFLFPSLYEGLGMVLIEAQTSGLKCFTSLGTVPTESSVTNLVSYLPLERGAKYWADEIYKAKDYNRYDRLDEIKKAGYDAKTSAIQLQNIYIELYNNAK